MPGLKWINAIQHIQFDGVLGILCFVIVGVGMLWQQGHKKLLQEVEQAQAELKATQHKLEEVTSFRGQFLSNMSHELRTPLNAVIGFSETMLHFPLMYDDLDLPAPYREDLLQIHESGKHLLNIINDILDLSKMDGSRLDVTIGRVELEPIFRGILATGVGLIGDRDVKLMRETPDDLPDLRGDARRVRQILLKLLSNAAKFTQVGTITLRLEHAETTAVISVEDTGQGVHPDDLDTIFEEFRQGMASTKLKPEGSGLGLAIAYKLVKLMDGDIWVESELGKGSRFAFRLPVFEVTKSDKRA